MVSGLLLTLSFPPSPLAPLVLVALVPWMRGLRNADSPITWMRSTAALFAVHWALQLAFLLPLTVIVAWAPLAWAAQVATLIVLGGVAGGVGYRLRRRRRWPVPVALAAGWWFVEFARGHLLGPLRFPWSPIALPLVETPVLVQPAAWGGEGMLAALIVCTNAAVVWAMEGRDESGGGSPASRPSRRLGSATVGLRLALPIVVVGVWTVAGLWRRAAVRTSPVVVPVAVQPAVPLEAKGTSAAAVREAVDSVESLLVAVRAEIVAADSGFGPAVDLIVLPETAVPVAVDTAPHVAARVQGWADRLGRPMLIGAWIHDSAVDWQLRMPNGERDPGGRYNAVIPWGPDGPLGPAYRKIGLVPGVEWDPFGDGVRRGTIAAPVRAPGDPGPLICIESAWSGLARRQAGAGAGWLVNPTNDAWLAEAPWWRRSTAFRQHPAHLALRSVETGLGALLVGNNGWTGATDPLGGWTPWLAPFRPGVARGQVHSLEGRASTLFVRGGWIVGPLAAVALTLVLILPGRAPR